MTKTLTTPLTTQVISPQERDEKRLYDFLHGSKAKVSRSTGLHKTPLEQYEDNLVQGSNKTATQVHEAWQAAAKIWAKQINDTLNADIINKLEKALEADMRSNAEVDRYRTFAEQFVLRRGPVTAKEGFDAVCDAKAIYKMIDNSADFLRAIKPASSDVVGVQIGGTVPPGPYQAQLYAQGGDGSGGSGSGGLGVAMPFPPPEHERW